MADKHPSIIAPLTGLKDFQQRTVNYVFQQFYGDKPQNRFLVADEVGLGKTMVARGIIAKVIEHLQDNVDRIDIIYICSNAAIAAQNIKRLNVSNEAQFSHSTRLTFLPKQVRSLRQNRINFISLTPNTALDHTRSRGGHKEERAILYRILYDLPLAKGMRRERLRKGMLNLLQAAAGFSGWHSTVDRLSVDDIDTELAKDFRRKVLDDTELYAQLKEGCECFADDDEDSEIHDSELRYTLIGKLRSKLASVCLSALEPDLVTRVDERWYWAAPALLDARTETPDWWQGEHYWYIGSTKNESAENFQEHIDLFIQMANGEISLGPRPDDLAEVLCDLALASPGTCALRALNRIDNGLAADSAEMLSGAAQIASGFRSLYNLAESISLLRGTGDDTYWRLTLRYGIDGNIQAMLDEYVHTLLESMGLQHESAEAQLAAIASRIQAVVSLRTTQLNIDEFKTKGGNYSWGDLHTRCRFALRYGQQRDDTNQAVAHAESVKDAFNSPFHPFVLASTSIGQEGLDFHTWCHAVMHWNLPSNPVDMEQREGRVHRYKGHAVRKNIAEHYGLRALHSLAESSDPWTQLFALAESHRKAGQSELVPYWIFEEGTSCVERRVPILPYSKESIKFKRLKRELALYRIVFGQPRQEDLLFGLKQSGNESLTDFSEWLISLEPPKI
ncbi:DEAD/DEAH box helicase [Salmonella enterica subsp. enterica serovar Omderman]|nr:DEAD/DEAH box helicase [Salmonella enterica subsp. enterica]EGI5835933.1 DEAD/DEAH box helicase [Salmonella enterica subsp. enterica serovar Omderman]